MFFVSTKLLKWQADIPSPQIPQSPSLPKQSNCKLNSLPGLPPQLRMRTKQATRGRKCCPGIDLAGQTLQSLPVIEFHKRMGVRAPGGIGWLSLGQISPNLIFRARGGSRWSCNCPSVSDSNAAAGRPASRCRGNWYVNIAFKGDENGWDGRYWKNRLEWIERRSRLNTS